MSIGIRQFDEHHRYLLDLILKLKAKAGSNDRIFLMELLNELVSYTKYHFTAEQRVMMQFDYPGTEEHTKSHKYFSERIKGFAENYNKNTENLSEEILMFLKDWLVTHILTMDKEYGIFLVKHGFQQDK